MVPDPPSQGKRAPEKEREHFPLPRTKGAGEGRTRTRPVHIGDVVRSVLKHCGEGNASDLSRVLQLWEGVVGATIAGNARPEACREGVLIVAAASSPWVQQLRYMEAEIIDKLNQALGGPKVSHIRFKVGKL